MSQMRQFELKRSQFKVSDFLGWQRENSLVLSPSFQRRSVWKPDAKSFFIDSVARGFPAPVIYIRERLDLERQRVVREIVDGQQRLRTLFSFIDEECLQDFDPQRDRFLVKSTHNPEIGNKPFAKLPKEVKASILGYEFSTHTLPTTFEDRDVLQMFARLNATGVKLNDQELRNAEFFGPFKTAMYDLALEQLERWREWTIVTEDQIARMREVEITSDLVMNIIDGLTGKSQSKLNRIYTRFDKAFPTESIVADRFRKTMDTIEAAIGEEARQVRRSHHRRPLSVLQRGLSWVLR
jgi:uncharacterized protein with ParB-like and HNH nuclease domain